jgi:hypothetical protein
MCVQPLERCTQPDCSSDEGGGVQHPNAPPIRITSSLQPGCGCAEAGDWVPAYWIAEESIGQVSDSKSRRRRPVLG